jgi:hypothetical protein
MKSNSGHRSQQQEVENKLRHYYDIINVTVPEATTTQHKSHIPKVIFLVALWPWGTSSNFSDGTHLHLLPAGTLETKSKSLTAEFYRELFRKPVGVIGKSRSEKMP